MNLPLYKGVNRPDKAPQDGHQGLWFDRFFDQYGNDQFDQTSTGIGKWMRKSFCNDPIGNKEALQSYALRQAHLSKSLNGMYEVYSLDWHFVTGMGNSHPIENGLSWHPTLGVPFISGSAVKGIMRSVVELYGDFNSENEKEQAMLLLFGSTTKDTSLPQHESHAGCLTFFDAIPISPIKLGCDIMTPHAGKWYEKGGNISSARPCDIPSIVPADWHDPVPVSFLSVHQADYLFSFARRAGDSEPDENSLESVRNSLQCALRWLGAGAKTATGYGYMSPNRALSNTLNKQLDAHLKRRGRDRLTRDQESLKNRQRRQEELEKQRELSSMSPFRKELEVLMMNSEKADPVKELAVQLTKQNRWEKQPEIEKEVAELIKEMWTKEEKWHESDPVSKSKKQQRKLCARVQKYL